MSNGIATSAAFIMEGVHEVGYKECVEAHGSGCLEMVSEMVGYANFADAICQVQYAKMPDGFPGVFDYEVSSEFGGYLARYLIEHHELPPTAEANAHLSHLADTFFAKARVEAQ